MSSASRAPRDAAVLGRQAQRRLGVLTGTPGPGRESQHMRRSPGQSHTHARRGARARAQARAGLASPRRLIGGRRFLPLCLKPRDRWGWGHSPPSWIVFWFSVQRPTPTGRRKRGHGVPSALLSLRDNTGATGGGGPEGGGMGSSCRVLELLGTAPPAVLAWMVISW